MNDSGRRKLTIGLALTALALLGAGVWVKSTVVAPPAAVEKAVIEDARRRAQAGLDNLLKNFTARAITGYGGAPNLIAALDSNVDAETFQDLFDTEEWWAGARANFPLNAILVKDGAADKSLARRGPEAFVRLAAPLIAAARAGKPTAAVLGDEDRAYVVAAAVVTGAKHADRTLPVLLLGRIADDKLLTAMAGQETDALALSSGSKLLAVTGPAPLRQAVADLIGREGQAAAAPWATVALSVPDVTGAPSRFSFATPITLSPKLWLWVTAGAPAPSGVPGAALILFGLGALAGVGAVAVQMIKRPADAFANDPGDVRDQAKIRSEIAVRPTVRATPASPALGVPSQMPVVPGSGIARGMVMRETLPMPRAGGTPASPAIEAGLTPSQPSLAVAVSPPVAPKQMGRYRLLRLIGEGGMAEIYIATAQGAEGFERNFVVKRLHPQMTARKEMVSQFIDEARLQARLLHSNIVSVFDFGTAGDEYFMALEYVHGRDFQQVVDRHIKVTGKPLPVSLVFYVGCQVLEALAYAHARTSPTGEPMGIVHRDISPANVLVSFLGEVKLSDFGIVKAEERVSQTDHGVIKGNVSYMSPEQARSENVDLRSDLFSLGLLMFYALTGRTFYQGDTMMGRLMLAAMGPDPGQLKALKDLPPEASTILVKALAIDPNARYQSAIEFARNLGGLAGNRTQLSETLKALYSEETRREH